MKQNQNLLFSFVMIFIMIVNGSCSKSSNTTTSNSSTPATVTIANMAFSPLSLSVKVGTTVTWKNNDGFAHTVTSNDGTSFNSGNLAGGSSFSYTTKTVGTFGYHCNIHPGMMGTLIVTQ
jgi:plastocyanin